MLITIGGYKKEVERALAAAKKARDCLPAPGYVAVVASATRQIGIGRRAARYTGSLIGWLVGRQVSERGISSQIDR